MLNDLLVALNKDVSLRRVTWFSTGSHKPYTIKLTRQRRHSKRDRSETFLLTIGRPNYLERALLKKVPRPGLVEKGWPKKRK